MTDLDSQKILLVDDDKVQATSLRSRLNKRGLEVEVAHSAEEATDQIMSGEFTVLLLDVMLPGISGIELLAQIRRSFSRYELPVIMVTARGESEDIVAGLNSGANDYLVKPVDPDVAAARIKNQLDLNRLSREQERRQRVETMTAMITTYNHEINNPLAIAVGNLSIFRSSKDESKLDRVEKALHRIEVIVRKIQNLQKSDAEFVDYVGKDKMFKVS